MKDRTKQQPQHFIEDQLYVDIRVDEPLYLHVQIRDTIDDGDAMRAARSATSLAAAAFMRAYDGQRPMDCLDAPIITLEISYWAIVENEGGAHVKFEVGATDILGKLLTMEVLGRMGTAALKAFEQMATRLEVI